MTADLLESCQREIAVLEGGPEAWSKASLSDVASGLRVKLSGRISREAGVDSEFDGNGGSYGSRGGTSGSVAARNQGSTAVIVSDQPAENGGHDEGMTPPELLLVSLGSCAAFCASLYLRKHKLASSGTRVRVTADKLKDPARIVSFRIEIEAPTELNDKDRARVESSVHHCLIHNTLLHPPKIVLAVTHPVPECRSRTEN